tara:strand:+ start:111 stop:371 length:261 start_codon:yes stop_codon:yes gene_type:complete
MIMYKIEIYVTLKADVLDPQGKAIQKAAERLNIKNIKNIRQGKFFEILLKSKSTKKEISNFGNILSKKLLCNEVIEDYKIINIKKI